MSTPVLWLLVGLGLGIVVVRRRSAANALLALQSLALGALALHEAGGASSGLLIAGAILLARGVAFPAILARLIRSTPEPRRVASEPFALGRLVAALAVVLSAVALVPDLGLDDIGTARAAVGLVVLCIVIAAARRPVVFQAIGFLVAENGVYLASLAVSGGVPAVIELGLLFDLIVLLSVIVAFGAKIHEQLGTGDTTQMETLRD